MPLHLFVPQRFDGASATMRLISAEGKTVRTIFDGTIQAGESTIRCDIGDLIPGPYLVVLHALDKDAVYRLMVGE